MISPIEHWDDLVAALDARPGEWVLTTAWAVGSGDPDGVLIRLRKGRSFYHAAWCVYGARGRERVRLARLDPGDLSGPVEVVRWLDPRIEVWVRRVDAHPVQKETEGA